MEEKLYSVTLSDGTVLSDLTLNGNNFISKTEIDESAFDGNCYSVTISDGENETEYSNLELVQVTQVGEEWWFVLRELSQSELAMMELQSSVEYVAMMSDIEL